MLSRQHAQQDTRPKTPLMAQVSHQAAVQPPWLALTPRLTMLDLTADACHAMHGTVQSLTDCCPGMTKQAAKCGWAMRTAACMPEHAAHTSPPP
jgi:hypothetical protein